jgi:Pyrimidine dimer DNA glycosylase
MRIWDISPKRLCRNHLLGEHRELHAIWSVLVNGKQGYARHSETIRWRGKLKALYSRHDALVREMVVRGYRIKAHCRNAWRAAAVFSVFLWPPSARKWKF